MIFHSVLFQQLWRVNICLACTGLHVVKKPATVSSQSQTAFPNPCTKRRCQCFKQRSRCGFFRPVIEPRYLETFTSLLINIPSELLRLQLIRYVQETPLAASKLANYWSGFTYTLPDDAKINVKKSDESIYNKVWESGSQLMHRHQH